jgi:DNA-binding NtrC family response regulator
MKISSIIDSDKEFLVFAERHLTLFGYQVYAFTDLNQFFDSLKLNPQLVILGDNLGKQLSGTEAIRKVRQLVPKCTLLHVAQSDTHTDAVSSIMAGATEFIEKNGATFVRLRTCLDLLEKQNQKQTNSIFGSIKKVFIG